MRKEPCRNPAEIAQQVSFGEGSAALRAGAQHLVQIGDRKLVFSELQNRLGLRCVELLEHAANGRSPDARPTFLDRLAGREARVRAWAGGLGLPASFRAASTLRFSASARSITLVSLCAGAFTTCLPSSLASISSASASR